MAREAVPCEEGLTLRNSTYTYWHRLRVYRSSSRPAARRIQRQPVEQRRAARLRAFDSQKPQLGHDTARRGEAADLAAGGQHAMTGHDDGNRILSERLTDVARQTSIAQPLGDFAV